MAIRMRELASGGRPSFVLVCNGILQFMIRDGIGTGLIVATNRPAAKKMAAKIHSDKGKRVAVAEVGTVTGESLSKEIAISVLRYGATGVFVTEDGENMEFFTAPPVPDDDNETINP